MEEPEFSSRIDKIRNLRTLTVADLDTSTAELAIDLLARYVKTGIGGRHAGVLATMRVHRIKRIPTHDRHFRKIKGIRIVDAIPKQS